MLGEIYVSIGHVEVTSLSVVSTVPIENTCSTKETHFISQILQGIAKLVCPNIIFNINITVIYLQLFNVRSSCIAMHHGTVNFIVTANVVCVLNIHSYVAVGNILKMHCGSIMGLLLCVCVCLIAQLLTASLVCSDSQYVLLAIALEVLPIVQINNMFAIEVVTDGTKQ